MKTHANIETLGTKLVVLGAGESGVGAAILARTKGYEVFVSDSGPIQDQYKAVLKQEQIPYEEHGHTLQKVQDADSVIKSPGIPKSTPLIQDLRKSNVRIWSEIEFAAQFTDAKLICITGSNGKSTTATLTWYMLKKGGLHVGLAGNIGQSFALQVARESYDYYVLEISSFMLDDMVQFKADIAVLLNITPDHLDRYDHRIDLYANSKMRIMENQTREDVFIYCADDQETQRALERHPIRSTAYRFSQKMQSIDGAYVDEQGNLIIHIPNQTPFCMSIHDLALQGKHNLYNNMASGIVAKVLELKNEAMRESMGEYQNIPHRLEHVARIAGINFINDSKATNVNSVWYALESVPEQVVLIMGGVDKGNDYNMLKELVGSKVKAIVCLGKDNKRLHDAFEEVVDVMVNTRAMAEAVEIAYHLAKKGDTVLLSPACASFDLFKNYEDRGDQFKKAVKEL